MKDLAVVGSTVRKNPIPWGIQNTNSDQDIILSPSAQLVLLHKRNQVLFFCPLFFRFLQQIFILLYF